MTALTLINGQLRLDSTSGQLVLAKEGTDEACCCGECGFISFDLVNRYYKYIMFIDFDTCYFSQPSQRVLPDGTPSPSGFDGFVVVEANCDDPRNYFSGVTARGAFSVRTYGKIIYSFGAFPSRTGWQVGDEIQISGYGPPLVPAGFTAPPPPRDPVTSMWNDLWTASANGTYLHNFGMLSATFGSLTGPTGNEGCGNPNGDKVGWQLLDKYP